MYIGDWMGRGASYWPQKLAVVDLAKGAQGRFTYAQMNERARALAGWLRDRGVRKGDRVGLLAPNGVENLDAFFACAKLGAIFVPFNWRLHPEELAGLVERTAPKVMLFSPELAALWEGARARVSSTRPELDIESPAYAQALSARPSTPVEEESVVAEDIVTLLFTGGTTGLPKGACVSYRMIAWNTLNTVVHELERGDVTVIHTPMFHTGGLFVYTLPLLTVGGTVLLMRKWDPDELLRLIGAEGVTMFFCVPTQYQQLAQSPRFRDTDFSKVRFMTSGGAALPVSLIEDWRKVHPNVAFKQGFGMTEFGPGIFSMGPEHAVSKAGSIGRPNYFIEARLVDENNRPVPVGEVGELVLKGPSMCSGYFEDAKATAETIDAEGWFHTGDLARKDADGFYFIADRKKDMFISGGENVYPVEIESVLYQHPSVHQCAVVGVPDPKWGEVGRAFVVLKPGADATSEGLLEFLRSKLARYKVPKAVELRPSLPISAAGKILKRELRDEAIRQ
ncbi:MAG TPA: long-chain fatty acid--CoA ligase [Myxococcaceae bacterium]|nr:long-chain fatty acid--CoA ligase [Myxococcaceae bacterium]